MKWKTVQAFIISQDKAFHTFETKTKEITLTSLQLKQDRAVGDK